MIRSRSVSKWYGSATLPGMRIRSDPLIFGLPDLRLFSSDLDPSCNHGYMKFFSSQNINENQQNQALNFLCLPTFYCSDPHSWFYLFSEHFCGTQYTSDFEFFSIYQKKNLAAWRSLEPFFTTSLKYSTYPRWHNFWTSLRFL